MLVSRSAMTLVPIAICVVGIATPASAGGFYLQEQSQLEIGRAFSGGAASADDPSTIFFNPAGMTELEGVQTGAGGTLLFISSRQRDRGTTRSGPGTTSTSAVGGGSGGNPFASVVPIPTSYLSAHVGDSPLWVGLGISAPFGLKLRYDEDFFGRYDSLYSNFFSVNVQPSMAIRMNEGLSIGGGIDVQYASATLTNALPNAVPGSADGHLRVKGNDVSLGWNLGVLAKRGPAQFGLHYRSRMKHELKGRYAATGLAGPLAAGNGETDLRAPIVLPDIVTASIKFAATDRFTLLATGRFYNWSVFNEIRLLPDGRAPAVKRLDYKDSWSVALGGDYRLSERLTLRAGTMFDRTPTNPDYLTTRIPDGDRIWASTGLSFALNGHMTVHASYAHVFIEKADMDRRDSFYAGSAAQIDAHIRSLGSGNVDMIATSVTTRF